MAEKIIPFARTVLLPAGSPAIGCVDGVRMDVSGLQCQSTGQACYCLGDADVLIEYHAAPADSGSLFGGPSVPGRAWQALLSLPVELACGSSEEMLALPPGSYQPMLRHLEWFMVASNAVELEGSLLLTWAEEEALAPGPQQAAEVESETAAESVQADMIVSDQAANQDEPFAVERLEQRDAALPEQAEAEAPRGLIWRSEQAGKGKQTYQSRGWTMINYNEEQTVENRSAVEEQIQQLAESAEQTVAETRQLWKDIEQRQAEQAEAEPEEEFSPDVEKTRAQDAPPEAEDSPPAVTLEEEQLREAVSLSLSGESETDAEDDDRETELREGVVVRMRFDSPASGEQKRLYYPGPVPEQNTDPKILVETLHEALGEEAPRPSARLTFGWDKELEAQKAASIGDGNGAGVEEGLSFMQAEDLPEGNSTETSLEEEQEISMLQEDKASAEAGAEDVPEQEAAGVASDCKLAEQGATAEQSESALLLKTAQPEKEAAILQTGLQVSSSSTEIASKQKQLDPPSVERVETAEAAAALSQQASPNQPEPPRVEADQAAVEESLDAALEPEILPPMEKRSRRRRAVGLPRLHIDARDNTVEISAFNLQIKL